jgi:hemin uptake protein HemP
VPPSLLSLPSRPREEVIPVRRVRDLEEVIPVHRARDLTGPGGLARILLDGQAYALRITRAGKLILTK